MQTPLVIFLNFSQPDFFKEDTMLLLTCLFLGLIPGFLADAYSPYVKVAVHLSGTKEYYY